MVGGGRRGHAQKGRCDAAGWAGCRGARGEAGEGVANVPARWMGEARLG